MASPCRTAWLRRRRRRAAIAVVDLRSGDAVHWLRMDGAVEELYDVAVLPAASGRWPSVFRRTRSAGSCTCHDRSRWRTRRNMGHTPTIGSTCRRSKQKTTGRSPLLPETMPRPGPHRSSPDQACRAVCCKRTNLMAGLLRAFLSDRHTGPASAASARWLDDVTFDFAGM